MISSTRLHPCNLRFGPVFHRETNLLRHVLVAVDESEASRAAVQTALTWAEHADARVTILTVVPLGRADLSLRTTQVDLQLAEERLARSLGTELLPTAVRSPQFIAVAGNPGVEVARFAEQQAVDLVVLGRKTRSTMTRLLGGDTADAIVRRSSVPCLLVPAPSGLPKRAVVALNGGPRSLGVFSRARGLLESVGASLKAVTVRPPPDERRSTLPQFRSHAGIEDLRQLLKQEGKLLRVREGDIVREVLALVVTTEASVLAVGYHRGGAPGVMEAGSVARRLAHSAPCMVLTIPL